MSNGSGILDYNKQGILLKNNKFICWNFVILQCYFNTETINCQKWAFINVFDGSYFFISNNVATAHQTFTNKPFWSGSYRRNFKSTKTYSVSSLKMYIFVVGTIKAHCTFGIFCQYCVTFGLSYFRQQYVYKCLRFWDP